MPLDEEARTLVLDYCARHLEAPEWFPSQIDFIKDQKLAAELTLAFNSARHMEKLGEALAVSGDRRHPHLKFQIVQYASIYEAIISHLLFDLYAQSDIVKRLRSDTEFVKVADLPRDVVDGNGSHLHICRRKKIEKDAIHIRFEQKLKAAEELGFLSAQHRPEILSMYRTRNAVHLESAARNSVRYEAKQATVAYKRLRPFLQNIRDHLAKKQRKKPA